MKTTIYYFSGTGNSLRVARDLAEKSGASTIPIASVIDEKEIKPDADTIGIIFPVYYNGLPPIIKTFAEKLSVLPSQYIFAVATYGGGMGDSFRNLHRILRARGAGLSATFGVHMPQNAFRKFWENHQRVFAASKRKLETIGARIARRQTGSLLSDKLWYMALTPLRPLFNSLVRNSLAKGSVSPRETPVEELIHRADAGFQINDKCNGCGICAKVCPVKNITMENNRPVWQHHCENCLACYNWCPNRAIIGTVAQKGYFYRHPEVTMAEIIEQRKTK